MNSLHDLQRESLVNGNYILSERRRAGGRKGGRGRKQKIVVGERSE